MLLCAKCFCLVNKKAIKLLHYCRISGKKTDMRFLSDDYFAGISVLASLHGAEVGTGSKCSFTQSDLILSRTLQLVE